ncbi:putative manganese transporter [Vibrio sp. RC27]
MISTSFSEVTKQWAKNSQIHLRYKRSILPILLIALLIADPTRDIIINTLADAFWAVSAYVAFTLAIYHYLSAYISQDNRIIRLYNRSRRYQVLFSALLGALPGCGGAIIVTTQFVSGRVGFGAIVAVLTSTMGDAAFLLVASEPKTGLAVIALGVIVGALSGFAVNAIHQDDFLRPLQKVDVQCIKTNVSQNALEKSAMNLQGKFWQFMLVPATVVAFLGSFQIDLNEELHLPGQTMEWIGAIAIIMCMVFWALTKEIKDYESSVSEDKKGTSSHPIQKTAQDTNFISAWVIGAFLAFELTTAFLHLDLAELFSGWGMWMPMIGLLVGLLPGCGPQILVTSMYLSGAVPMSTQLSNSISNDGDALFPAIALAPKAALYATFYSAIPAFIVGYGYYFLFEL